MRFLRGLRRIRSRVQSDSEWDAKESGFNRHPNSTEVIVWHERIFRSIPQPIDHDD